jgi:CheY-like chemotaxis protein
MASILVIDDNQANLDLMVYLLRACGHNPVGRSDSESALEEARGGEYALVLCDILMPGIDGYEFARRFKGNSSRRMPPLVAVTALAMPGDRERIAAVGFDGYLRKPIEPEIFVKQVEAFLQSEK